MVRPCAGMTWSVSDRRINGGGQCGLVCIIKNKDKISNKMKIKKNRELIGLGGK